MDPERVAQLSSQYFYFEAIEYILKVKKGPFHEHSSMLYNISGMPTWKQIHVGLVKMYKKEVLGKFPVVQHLKFGKYLKFTEDI